MKEILDAFETTVRRIVREELSGLTPAAPVSDPVIQAGPRFDEMVKQAVLDKQWFDDAIKSEAATAAPATPVWDATTLGEHLMTQLRTNEAVSDVINNLVSNMVDDRLPDMDRYVRNDDLHDEVVDAVRNMNFLVSVD